MPRYITATWSQSCHSSRVYQRQQQQQPQPRRAPSPRLRQSLPVTNID